MVSFLLEIFDDSFDFLNQIKENLQIRQFSENIYFCGLHILNYDIFQIV